MLRWLFLDMNSYFASVEQQDHPHLRDRPVAVAPVMSEGSCCIAASVQAKARGIRTGTRVAEARRICPGLRVVGARPRRYVQVHHQLIEATERVLPVTKVYSIDEWAIALLGAEREPARASTLAQHIKTSIYDHVGSHLLCSVGIAPTRLLAKVACELHKPDGLTALDMGAMPGPIEHLALDDLPGIGRGRLPRLHQHGITTITQLWNLRKHELRAIWGGVEGDRWWSGFHGIDLPEVVTHRGSISHANVLAPAFRSDEGAHGIMTRLLHKAAARLRHHAYWATSLSVSVRYESGREWFDQCNLPVCRDTATILEHFESLWQRPRRPRTCSDDRPKKVSITLGGLCADAVTPEPLFEADRRRHQLAESIDRINRRWGTHTIYFGGMHNCRQPMDDKIAFGRIPDEAVQM